MERANTVQILNIKCKYSLTFPTRSFLARSRKYCAFNQNLYKNVVQNPSFINIHSPTCNRAGL